MRCGTIWIDVTELFDLFRFARHPTGISRTILNLADALVADSGEAFCAARPLFWHPIYHRPLTCDGPPLLPMTAFFSQLKAMYDQAGPARTAASSRTIKAIATSLPRSLRYRLFPADNGAVWFASWARRRGIRVLPVNFSAADSLFVPGSFWLGRFMPRLIARARKAGSPVTIFVHDMLLLSHPEWLPGRHSDQFRRGCETILPSCAAIVCNSQNTRDELRRFVPLRDGLPIENCRLADRAVADPAAPAPPAISQFLDKQYVLYVSTIIPRKNHKLLVEAWQQLWQQLGPATPYLLFVGGGAPDGALAAMMEREKSHGNRITWLGGIEDADLELLYRHAWMTAYASFGEGYGLPVAEALARGKVCLTAPSGGIREIDENLIDFIDPCDWRTVVAKLQFYLSDPTRLAARETEIRQNYRSTGWPETARAVRTVIENTMVRS